MKVKKICTELVGKLAKEAAVKNANSSCPFFLYQPELPEKIKKLRKF
jgi:cyclic lactone autoinducer peptide